MQPPMKGSLDSQRGPNTQLEKHWSVFLPMEGAREGGCHVAFWACSVLRA